MMTTDGGQTSRPSPPPFRVTRAVADSVPSNRPAACRMTCSASLILAPVVTRYQNKALERNPVNFRRVDLRSRYAEICARSAGGIGRGKPRLTFTRAMASVSRRSTSSSPAA